MATPRRRQTFISNVTLVANRSGAVPFQTGARFITAAFYAFNQGEPTEVFAVAPSEIELYKCSFPTQTVLDEFNRLLLQSTSLQVLVQRGFELPFRTLAGMMYRSVVSNHLCEIHLYSVKFMESTCALFRKALQYQTSMKFLTLFSSSYSSKTLAADVFLSLSSLEKFSIETECEGEAELFCMINCFSSTEAKLQHFRVHLMNEGSKLQNSSVVRRVLWKPLMAFIEKKHGLNWTYFCNVVFKHYYLKPQGDYLKTMLQKSGIAYHHLYNVSSRIM